MVLHVEQLRNLISTCYKTNTWKSKVQKMPNEQVIAIYYSFKKRGIIQ